MKIRAEEQPLDAVPARPSCTYSLRGKKGTVGGNLEPIGKGSMPGPLGGESLLSIPELPGPTLTLTQQYLDQEDAVITKAECSIHGAGEILPPV